MAKNWKVNEVIVTVANNDMEGILDIGRRFPLLLTLVKGMLEGNKEDVITFANALPEYDTANKVNSRLKAKFIKGEEKEEKEEEVTETEEEVEEEKPVKKEKKAKKPAKKEEEEVEEETEANEYEGKSAQELFKLCKKRGLSVPAKKTAKYYADVLIKDDAKQNETEDEDWEEEVEEEKPAKKPAKKAPKKPVKKEEPEETDDDDDDEDWDI